jgi:hypothetical protein
VIHLILFTTAILRYASRSYWDQLARDLKGIYTAQTDSAAWAAFEELEWGCPLWGRSGPSRSRRSPSCGARPGTSSPRCWPTQSSRVTGFSTHRFKVPVRNGPMKGDVITETSGGVDVASSGWRACLVLLGPWARRW